MTNWLLARALGVWGLWGAWMAGPAISPVAPAPGAPVTSTPTPTPTQTGTQTGMQPTTPVALIWNHQRSPAPGPPQAIGGYSSGCLQGAMALPPSGPGYEALHRSRNRFFGHPTLVEFIRRLGAAAKAQRLGVVVVGDLSQARGGPTPSGHRSHQSGLDVDVGYRAPPGVRAGHLRAADRERLGPPAVVDLGTHVMSPLWNRRTERLVAAAAADPAVDRIFVNPAIRRTLCAGPSRRAPWFARVRPWWGHHDHFHVRLKCPADSPLCKPQDPPPPDPDDGCGATLAWWFSPDAQTTETKKKQADETQGPVLPEACAGLLGPAPQPTSTTAATPRPAAASTPQ